MTPRAPLPDLVLGPFDPDDLAELVVLQRCCWTSEAIVNETLDIPALRETATEVLEWTTTWATFVVRRSGRLVGAVRGRSEGSDWQVGRLMVAPDLVGQGIGSWLLNHIEEVAPPSTVRYILFTGSKSTRNIAIYQRAGYRLEAESDGMPPGHIAGAVLLTKRRDI